MIYVVLGIFILTYLLLVFRKIGGRAIPIWASMVIGAVLMVVTFSITPLEAFDSIDFRVISFLFGMLVITTGFEKSGLIDYIALSVLKRARRVDRLLLGIIFGAGFLSALFVNDTIALLWTPIVLSIGSKVGIKQDKVLLLPLAFGITVGSAISPIGNPQNLLVALDSGMLTPFGDFLIFLFVPAVLSMFAVYYICKTIYRKQLTELPDLEQNNSKLPEPRSAVSNWRLAKLSAGALACLLAGFATVEIFPSLQLLGLSLSTLALLFGLGLLALTQQRSYILVSMSWGVLIFFGGMFVVMGAVWNSGIGSILLSALPTPILNNSVQSTGSIMLVSVVLSQILSNVPFVQLYSYQMHALGFTSSSVVPWLALAAGSTLAGNLSLLGAVSNVIVVDAAESRSRTAFSFIEFSKVGVLITVVTCLIFFLFLAFV